MFEDTNAEIAYIMANYPEVTGSRMDEDHWGIFCSKCDTTCGFQVVKTTYTDETSDTYYRFDTINWLAPRTVYFKCPICGTYKFWILFCIPFTRNEKDGQKSEIERWYKITSIPNDGSEDIEGLPDKPDALRVAYRQAVRAMDANAHIAAAVMFRRALQVITRDILGAKPGSLARELESVVGTKYKGVTVSENFSKVGYIVKEIGNQGAHPARDPDLLNFTQQDAKDLQGIFIELVSELFVAPEVARKTKANLLKSRKINS